MGGAELITSPRNREEEVVSAKHEIDMRGLTPTQRQLIAVLLDGEWHWMEQLVQCLDSQASRQNVHVHLSAIRKLLVLQGRGLHAEKDDNSIRYRIILAPGTPPPRPSEAASKTASQAE